MTTPPLVRYLALACCGAALVWLAGCGGSTATDDKPRVSLADQLEQRNAETTAKKQADTAAAEAAEQEQLANEAPTVVTEDDFKRGKKLKGGGYLSTTLRAGIVAEQRIGMIQIQQAMALFNATEGRFPKSHDEFMEKIIKANGIQLEPLEGPYEYWYNAEEHELYKRPIVQGDAEPGSDKK